MSGRVLPQGRPGSGKVSDVVKTGVGRPRTLVPGKYPHRVQTDAPAAPAAQLIL
jgi:hypothetical protein